MPASDRAALTLGLTAESEAIRVNTFIRYAERDRLVATGQHKVTRCDRCSRYAMPGQMYCSVCLTPELAP